MRPLTGSLLWKVCVCMCVTLSWFSNKPILCDKKYFEFWETTDCQESFIQPLDLSSTLSPIIGRCRSVLPPYERLEA